MIRVIYTWQVTPENFERFREIWRTTTERVHQTVPGALGSLLLQSPDDESRVMTIARWESHQAWQDFWGNSDPKEMQAMSQFAESISVSYYSEVEDRTKSL